MMIQLKLGLVASLLSFGFSTASAQTTLPVTAETVVQNYAAHVFEMYSKALSETEKMDASIDAFLADPTAEKLEAAKLQWTEARKVYSQTEVFRFYAGPIDVDGGPEGLINAWPLDEAYIDYVRGDLDAGIINDAATYPTLDEATLESLNEKDGEKNISTGYHAIEFILWGQDLSVDGPGNRPVTDFTTAKNADRRKQYLTTISNLLLGHLQTLVSAWQPTTGAYAAEFTAAANVQTSLTNIFTGTIQLAGFELSQERMYVAYEEQLEEDEHSCFSDTTHFDILFNFKGIENVVLGTSGLIELINQSNPALASQLRQAFAATEANILSIPTPFDQALFSDEGGVAILASVTSLEDLGDLLKTAAEGLNAYAVPVEEVEAE